MPDLRIRPIGRPKVERDPSGLRKITRKYVVQGPAVAANLDADPGPGYVSPNIEDDVFLPFGTLDEEYLDITQNLGPGYESMVYTDDLGDKTVNAYLVAQEVTPDKEVTQAFLTRLYQELEDTPDPVQMGQDKVKLSDAKRLTVQRTFVVKNHFTNEDDDTLPTYLQPDSAITPFLDHYDPERIGSDFITITHDGTPYKCYLGGVESKENEIFTEFTETYFEDAILSETIEYKNGLKPYHKLEIRTIKAITGSDELTKPSAGVGPIGGSAWYLVSEREGTGNSDFGQTGKPVSTRVWAKGWGVISESKQTKHNGKLDLVTLKSLGEQTTIADISEPSSSGKPYVHVSSNFQESSGHQIYTDTYASGYGLVSESSEDKGLTQIVTEIWVTPPNGEHGSSISNIFSTKVVQRDGYDVHTISGTSDPEGIIALKTQVRHNGALELTTISKIGSASVITDIPISGNGATYVKISDSVDQTGRFNVYTDIWAAGTGLVSSSFEEKGSIEIVTEVWITEPEEFTGLGDPDPDVPGELDNVFSYKVDHRDGYDMWTVGGTTEATGILDIRRSFRHNGLLEEVAIKQIGGPAEIGPTTTGDPPDDAAWVRTSEAVDYSGRWTVYTDTFTAGFGKISSDSETKGSGDTSVDIVTEVWLLPNGTTFDYALSEFDDEEATFSIKVDENDGYEVHTLSGITSGTGVIGLQRDFREFRSGHKVEIVTVKTVGREPEVGDAGDSTITDFPEFVQVSADFDDSGRFTVWTYEFAAGRGTVELSTSHKHNGAVTTYREKSLNVEPTTTGNLIKSETDGDDGYTVYDYTWVVPTQTKIFDHYEDKGNDFKLLEQTWVVDMGVDETGVAHDLDNVYSVTNDQRDGYVLLTINGTNEETAIVSTRVEIHHQGALKIVTISKMGSEATETDVTSVSDPVEDGDGLSQSFVLIMTRVSNEGRVPVYTSMWASGSGEISSDVRDNGTYEVTTVKTLNEGPEGTVHDHSTQERDGHTIHTWKTYSTDSEFDGNNKQWINAAVYKTTIRDVASAALDSSTLADESSDSGEGCTQVAPGIWTTSKTTVGVDGVYKVIQATSRFNSRGYFEVVKHLASSGGVDYGSASYVAEKPDNAVLVSQQSVAERGWTRTVFNWICLSSDPYVTTRVESVPWTYPGVVTVKELPPGTISNTPRYNGSLLVTKRSELTTTIPDMSSYPLLYTPSVYGAFDATFNSRTNDVSIRNTWHNYVYDYYPDTSASTQMVLFGRSTASLDHTLSGTTKWQWNADASSGYYLGADFSTLLTDGTTTIYQVDSVQGYPTLGGSASGRV